MVVHNKFIAIYMHANLQTKTIRKKYCKSFGTKKKVLTESLNFEFKSRCYYVNNNKISIVFRLVYYYSTMS